MPVRPGAGTRRELDRMGRGRQTGRGRDERGSSMNENGQTWKNMIRKVWGRQGIGTRRRNEASGYRKIHTTTEHTNQDGAGLGRKRRDRMGRGGADQEQDRTGQGRAGRSGAREPAGEAFLV